MTREKTYDELEAEYYEIIELAWPGEKESFTEGGFVPKAGAMLLDLLFWVQAPSPLLRHCFYRVLDAEKRGPEEHERLLIRARILEAALHVRGGYGELARPPEDLTHEELHSVLAERITRCWGSAPLQLLIDVFEFFYKEIDDDLEVMMLDVPLL